MLRCPLIICLLSAAGALCTRRQLISTGVALLPTAARAADDDAALKARLAERRQLLELSRSSPDRQRYFDASRQRAALYNATSKAWSCPPNVPCY